PLSETDLQELADDPETNLPPISDINPGEAAKNDQSHSEEREKEAKKPDKPNGISAAQGTSPMKKALKANEIVPAEQKLPGASGASGESDAEVAPVRLPRPVRLATETNGVTHIPFTTDSTVRQPESVAISFTPPAAQNSAL